MTWKVLSETKFSNALAVGLTPQYTTLYTVPAAKTATVKEIIITIPKLVGGSTYHIYVLKSGGTDLGAGAAANVNFSSLDALVVSPGADVQLLSVANVGITVNTILARNTLLSTGDIIKLVLMPVGADAADADRVKIIISGDES